MIICWRRNIGVLLAPSKSNSASVVRLAPLKGRILSVKRLWRLRLKGQSSSYTLPDGIVESAIESVWSAAEKVADFAGITPEVLLEGG